MIIIPAVDIKNGKCVRLLQGRMDAETVFSDDPAAMAKKWADQGARLMHLVDLDGAVQKRPRNLAAIEKIIDSVNTEIQVGGGIRDLDTIRMYMDRGVEKIVIGSAAIHDPSMVAEACRLYPGHIVVGIDARDGMVAIEGWTRSTSVSAVELAKQFEDCGVAAINFTDIQRDGMQTGPNIDAIQALASSVDVPIVASGGVSSLADIKALMPLREYGVTGVITGRALYDGRLDLAEAIAAAAL
ncbi:MAG: 1-(5-phosphoribosyl)-5-[(5-phosphoribosylamino)methylideneamino]imidazole-4-carboxamide isomerase [Thermodesulfobacteriota bacterium]|nr:1-(5-phosphoribosyl)-5-[(5-phosphoribosylamino)methylideneamino]imidazole-4-carboxamide isomerase [Thermodesulfobacteriota bacterium]